MERRAPPDADRHSLARLAREIDSRSLANDGGHGTVGGWRRYDDSLGESEFPQQAPFEGELFAPAGVDANADNPAFARVGEQPDHFGAAHAQDARDLRLRQSFDVVQPGGPDPEVMRPDRRIGGVGLCGHEQARAVQSGTTDARVSIPREGTSGLAD